MDLRVFSRLAKHAVINLEKRVIMTGSLDIIVCPSNFLLLPLSILRLNIVLSISSELRRISLYWWQTKLK